MSDFEKSSGSVPEGKDAAYAIDQRRRAALAEIDNAKFSYVLAAPFVVVRPLISTVYYSWFHIKVVLVAGVGFFTDASVISSTILMRILKKKLATISSPSILPLSCWVMSTATVS
jgi:hypothetical protein